jgi:DNA-directed RNA polymerase specialized sigma24 family protein
MTASPFASIDIARAEALAARASRGERAAWHALIEHLWPALQNVVSTHRSMGAFAGSEDHVRDVVTRVLHKLGKDGARGLANFAPWHDRYPDRTFADWIRIVTVNAIRDHVREQLGDAAAFEDPSVKRLLNEFSTSPQLDQLKTRPPITDAQTARELLEFATTRLPPLQLRALVLWIEGASFDDIDAELGLGGADAATRVVRAAVAVLRREFAMPKKSPPGA